MNNKRHIELLVLLLISVSLTGCLNDLFSQKDLTYQDDPQLEFRPLNATEAEDAGAVEVLVQLIGPQQDSDTPISFSVNSSETDAVEGTHYDLATSSPVSLAANSSAATITINLNGTTLNDGEIRTLVLTLDESNEITPAENLKTHTLIIEGVDGN